VDKRRFRLKLVLLGDPGVGKTSLIRRYVDRTFDEDYVKTLGAVVSRRVDRLKDEEGRPVSVDLLIWDIMGQKRIFDLVREAYLSGAHGAMAVFSVANAATFRNLNTWIEASRGEQPRLPIMILGNKVDLADQRVVSDEEARRFCAAGGLLYLPTSARSGEGVEEAFTAISQAMVGNSPLRPEAVPSYQGAVAPREPPERKIRHS
jgi:small GTP-binding protein